MINEIEIIQEEIKKLKKEIELLNKDIVNTEHINSCLGDFKRLDRWYDKSNKIQNYKDLFNAEITRLNTTLSYFDKIKELKLIIVAIDKYIKDNPNRYDNGVLLIKRESIEEEIMYLESIIEKNVSNIKNKR